MRFKIGDQFIRLIEPQEAYPSLVEWIWILGEITDIYKGKNYIDFKFKVLLSSNPSLVDPTGGFTNASRNYSKFRLADMRSKKHLLKVIFLSRGK